MPTFEASIKTVPTGTDFKVTTEAGSIGTARQQIEKLYDPIYIRNLREVGGGSSFTDAGDVGGWVVIGSIVFVLWLIVEYWWIILPIAVICLIAWLYSIFSK